MPFINIYLLLIKIDEINDRVITIIENKYQEFSIEKK